MILTLRSALATLLVVSAVGLHADPLPLNEKATVKTHEFDSEGEGLTFTPEASGLLVVMVKGRDDLSLVVLDRYGQDLLDGYGDMDLAGDPGSESVNVPLAAGEEVRVVVQAFEEAGTAELLAVFVPVEGLGDDKDDPHGNPDEALDLPLGETLTESIDAEAGDRRDWYLVHAERDGHLTIFTDGANTPQAVGGEGFDGDFPLDASLEVFAEDRYRQPLAYSDSDAQGDFSRESVTLRVKAGEAYYARVSGYGSGNYTIRAVASE